MHASPEDPRELTIHARELGLGRRAITLDGHLSLGWCENLSTHFAARGASVERLVATSDTDHVWRVEIELLGGAVVDVRRGLSERETIDARLYELRIELGKTWTERDGAIGLEVIGRDRRGLLAALLRRFAMHGLFPTRLDVRTRDEHIHDRFVMRGFSGSSPPPGVAERILGELIDTERRGAALRRPR